MTPADDNLLLLIGRLEGKVDALLAASRNQATALNEHDNRISKLENNKAYILGIAAAVAAIASFILHHIQIPGPLQ